MTAQVINFPANQVCGDCSCFTQPQPLVDQDSATDVVSFAPFANALIVSLAIAIPVVSKFFYGTPGCFLALGIEILAFCLYALVMQPAASVQPQQAVATAVSVAPAKPVVEVSLAPSADVITKFFNDVKAFKWNYETAHKYEADKKLYFRSKFKSLEAQANSPMLAKILNDFRAHHYDSAAKPELAHYL